MARAIDSEAAYRFLSEQLVKETGAFSKGVNKGLNIARSAMRNPDAIPTLTPPNELLPVLVNDEPDREYIDYICPRCKDIISQRRRAQRMETVYQCKYHDNCGQCVDWNNSQPYRRPPEGEEDT